MTAVFQSGTLAATIMLTLVSYRIWLYVSLLREYIYETATVICNATMDFFFLFFFFM